jgi:hypothetical protein
VAAQVGVELAVGESGSHGVGPVQGQRGLADTGGPGDDRHGYGLRVVAVFRQEAAETAQLPAPVDEVAHVAAQLPGHHGGHGLLVEVHSAVDLPGLYDGVRRSRALEPVRVPSAAVHP